MKAQELREMTGEELLQLQKKRQDDLFAFRVQLATGVVENNRVARNARRDIARIKTILRERELAADQAKGNK